MRLRPPTDPILRFQEILQRAWDAGIENSNAMVLSTVDPEGRPLSRNVLLKDVDARGFTFYTNLESRKGRHLAENPHVSLNFYWRELGEQIIITGKVTPVSDEEADAYFATRPRNSQLGAWASRQSRPLSNRAQLLADIARYEVRFLGRPVPRPEHWSGFRVGPSAIEFWTDGAFRLHRRERYVPTETGWEIERLYP